MRVSNFAVSNTDTDHNLINIKGFNPDLVPISLDEDFGSIAHINDIVEFSNYPFKCVCLLKITDHVGNNYHGTGFFISSRCVITAGHNVFFKGRWARKIEVVPGAGINSGPYGSSISTHFLSTNNWTKYQNENYDYAAVLLPDDSLYNNVNACFNFTKIQNNVPLIISGYPINHNLRQQTKTGSVESLSLFQIFHNVQTLIGNSGSPVYIQTETGFSVVGVHIAGGPGRAVRVTDNVISNWINWSNQIHT